MRGFLTALCISLLYAASACADTAVCVNGRCGLRQPAVVIQSATPPSVCIAGCRGVTVVTAQEHAEHLAATGTFGHCGRRGGGFEGIGFDPCSPDAAVRRCCYWGRRPVREIGTAWSPARRGWVAVVRYE